MTDYCTKSKKREDERRSFFTNIATTADFVFPRDAVRVLTVKSASLLERWKNLFPLEDWD